MNFTIIFLILLTSSRLKSKSLHNCVSFHSNYEISYEKAIKKANEYAILGEVEKSFYFAKRAYEKKATKESMLALARVFFYLKDYKSLLVVSKKILKKDPNNYLGLKYASLALLHRNELKEAYSFIEKGLKRYKEDEGFIGLKEIWYKKMGEV